MTVICARCEKQPATDTIKQYGPRCKPYTVPLCFACAEAWLAKALEEAIPMCLTGCNLWSLAERAGQIRTDLERAAAKHHVDHTTRDFLLYEALRGAEALVVNLKAMLKEAGHDH